MLRILSKSAQQLSLQDDAQLTRPYREMGQFVRDQWKRRQHDKAKARWSADRVQWENQRNVANGSCGKCGLPLVKDKGKTFCPDPACSSTKFPNSP